MVGAGCSDCCTLLLHCSPSGPDVSSTTIRIWRHDFGNGKFYLLAEKTSNQRGTNWAIGVTGSCAAKIRYGFHTEVINDSFHGSWGHTDKNSTEVNLYC